MIGNARKALVGSIETHYVLMPEPWTGAPTLTFRRGGVETAGAGFAVLQAADSVTAISGTTLTGTFAAGPGFAGPEWGLAFLRTAQDGDFPVQVERVNATTAIITEPLPRVVTCTALASASLIWRWWSAPLPAAITATETGTAPADWWVEYTAQDGAAIGSRASQRISGTLSVVAAVFSTGCGTEVVAQHYGRIVGRPSTHDRGWSGPIEAARLQLLSYVRSRLNSTASGAREDAINGSDFLAAHAAWAASIIIFMSAPEASDRLAASARTLADEALAAITWHDPDGDGIGAHGTPASKGALLIGGTFPARSTTAINPFGYRTGPARGTS